ncbi:6-phosphogluconolactonase [Pseudoclavibacter endophyticus]|nr:6-phosphogluconolactonase [Pseudoclavibacter endophyticus]GGA56842.1 6-phosphogluconolactonase [Pseudoclavibacter endophyticus]
MTPQSAFQTLIVPDSAAAAHETAERFVELVRERGLIGEGADAPRGEVHIAVSGGSVATSVVPAMVAAGESAGVDWSRVHVWFADERFAPRGHEDRNAVPIVQALREASGFDRANLHTTLTSDMIGIDVAEAARAYEQELSETVAALDLVLLGTGPDGHTASLFPGHPLVTTPPPGRSVVEILDSPKPPPQRVTLTLEAIRASGAVWAIVTGDDKADAVATASRADVADSDSPLAAALRSPGRAPDEIAGSRLLIVDERAASPREG